jgi:hypothetical protein
MSEQTSNPFFGYCRCGVPGLYAMHEGLVASGRVIWFCQEHKPDFRQLQREHAMSRLDGEKRISTAQAPPSLKLNETVHAQESGRAQPPETQIADDKEGAL